MTEFAFHPVPVSPQKRSHTFTCSGASFQSILPTIEYSMTQPPSSPAPSTLSSLTDISALGSTTNTAQTLTGPPTKKRKLNFIEKEAEKAEKQREKGEKQRLKAEEKARKDEEKARKDEEKRKAAEERESAKRIKDVEKAEKQKVKDAEKSKKEAEKAEKEAAKEAARLKKERSQMRLGAFFAKPTTAGTSPLPSTPDDVSEGVSSRRSSVASIDADLPVRITQPTQPTQATPSKNTDFDKWILPFFVGENTAVAPHNRFKSGKQCTEDIPVFVDGEIEPLPKRFKKPRDRAKRLIPVKELFYQLQEPIDKTAPDTAIRDALQSYTFKIIQFHEDVRPPYQGTITRTISPRTSRRLAINPNHRELPDLNYDYDSEAEWEPPAEDDEDLDGEDEMSDVDDNNNEEEMADFLDDAEDIGRRKGLLADMEPVSSGLCWDDSNHDIGIDLAQYRMDVLHDSVKFPIDPFSTKHWTDTERTPPTTKHDSSLTSMQPPRYPLATLTANIIPQTKKDVGIDGKPLPSALPNKPVKLIDSEYMPAFKAAIVGSDLTKAGLIEVLKKQFPKCSKDAIKDTIGVIAVRVGKKESEKKWELTD